MRLAAENRRLRRQLDEGRTVFGEMLTSSPGMREVFELTCALSAYPSVPEFAELQKHLGRAMDAEANLLAARDVRERELQSA